MKFQKPLQLFYLLILSSFFLSCGGGGDDDPVPLPSRTAEDVIADFNALPINTGINDLALESLQEGDFWNFRIIMPEGAGENNLRPLVLNLHGAARSTNPDLHKSTACLIEAAFEGEDVIVVSPNSNGLLWYEEYNMVQVLALMDLVSQRLPVDLNRSVVTGYSDGGNGSWFYAQFYPGLFTAAIPMATSYNTKTSSGAINKIEIPLYVIHGEEDELFPLEVTETFVYESIDAGSSIEFIVAPGLTHNEVCNYVDYLKEAVVWLNTDVW